MAFKIVFEDKILFEFGEYDLNSSSLNYIDKVAETLKELPSTIVRITGFTDNVGSLASNRRLSTQRANAVSEYLQQKGISASRIIAKGVPYEKNIDCFCSLLIFNYLCVNLTFLFVKEPVLWYTFRLL